MGAAHPSGAASDILPHVLHYRAYGLAIASEVALPELVAVEPFDETDADLVIRLRAVEGPMPLPNEPRLAIFSEGRAYFSWSGLGRFLVRDNREIDVDPADGKHDLLSMILLGPVLAAVLHARGQLVLHGSAVDIGNDRVIAFVGDNGAGKSTLAAAFVSAGHALVSDDVVAVECGPGGAPQLLPSFPSMKLSREAIAALAPLPGELLASSAANPFKQRLRLDSMTTIKRRLARIYVLKRGESVEICPLHLSERLAAAMRFSYMFKFGDAALAGSAAAHLARCAMLAGQTAISTLVMPDDLAALRDLPALILADIQ